MTFRPARHVVAVTAFAFLGCGPHTAADQDVDLTLLRFESHTIGETLPGGAPLPRGGSLD